MDSTKYQNILDYVNSHAYPEGFLKQEKLVLRKFAKNFEFDPQSKSLFYIDKRKDGTFVNIKATGRKGGRKSQDLRRMSLCRFFWPCWQI